MQIQVPKVKKSKMHATKRQLTKADNNKENPWKLKRNMKMEGNEGGPRGTDRETQDDANWQRAREEHRFKYRRANVQGERRVKDIGRKWEVTTETCEDEFYKNKKGNQRLITTATISRIQYIVLHFQLVNWISHKKQGYLSALVRWNQVAFVISHSCIFSKCPGSITFHFIPSTNIWEKVLIQQKKCAQRKSSISFQRVVFVFAQMYELSRWMHMLSVAPQTFLPANSTVNTVFL